MSLRDNIAHDYVGRAGLKLEGANKVFKIDFRGKTVLDIGSSTGGFSDFSLKNAAKKIIAVEKGTDQLHPKLKMDSRIELLERTDIRKLSSLSSKPDIVLIDVSFVSLREILPYAGKLAGKQADYLVLLKPQFEAPSSAKHQGIIKNEHIRRQILKDFESWIKQHGFIVVNKADSPIAGAKGNKERFYLLNKA